MSSCVVRHVTSFSEASATAAQQTNSSSRGHALPPLCPVAWETRSPSVSVAQLPYEPRGFSLSLLAASTRMRCVMLQEDLHRNLTGISALLV